MKSKFLVAHKIIQVLVLASFFSMYTSFSLAIKPEKKKNEAVLCLCLLHAVSSVVKALLATYALNELGSYSSFKTPLVFHFLQEAFSDSPRLGEGQFFAAPLAITVLIMGYYNCLLEYLSPPPDIWRLGLRDSHLCIFKVWLVTVTWLVLKICLL